LRKDFNGTVAKGSFGTSQAGGGSESKVSITHGFGSLEQDKFNVLLNLEIGKVGEINNRDRSGRGQIGKSDGRAIGYDFNGTIGGVGAGGTGAIIANNAAGSSSVAKPQHT
jgi:iron complex outermembrane recepter protein